jgi:hypothetical protein
MIEPMFFWCFALCALAVWRVAHLVAKENGPLGLIARLRTALGPSILGRLMDCFYCVSFLVALSPALWISRGRIGFLIQWLALSAVASLLELATQNAKRTIRVTPVSTSYIDKVIRGV